MAYLKTDGIVIKEVSTGDADKVITIFSREKGKISCLVKGAKKPTSRYIGGTQFLCYTSFTLFKGKGLYIVNACDLIDCFYNIRDDIYKLTYASYIADIIIDVVQENQPLTDLLNLFLDTLNMLSNSGRNMSLMVSIFELKLICIAGYTPYYQQCTCCHSSLDCLSCKQYWFSFNRCGLVCDKCKNFYDEPAIKISSGTLKAISHIICAGQKTLFSFNLSASVLQELCYITHRYLEERLEKKYNKLNFLLNI